MYALNDVVKGYVKAICFTEEIDSEQKFYNKKEVMENITEQCKSFMEKIQEFIAQMEKCGITAERVGTCFWFDRNGHGTGFWDENCIMVEVEHQKNKMLSDELTKVAKTFGEYWVIENY